MDKFPGPTGGTWAMCSAQEAATQRSASSRHAIAAAVVSTLLAVGVWAPIGQAAADVLNTAGSRAVEIARAAYLQSWARSYARSAGGAASCFVGCGAPGRDC